MSPRITTGRIMVAVACISVISAYGTRWRRYERLAAHHDYLAAARRMELDRRNSPSIWIIRNDEVSIFHTWKSGEYKRAAPWPWISVVIEEPPKKETYPPSFWPDSWRNVSEADQVNPSPVSP